MIGGAWSSGSRNQNIGGTGPVVVATADSFDEAMPRAGRAPSAGSGIRMVGVVDATK
jgi:hypothetical protein